MDDATQAKLIRDRCHTGDNENDHWSADVIIVDMLKELGYLETAKAWEEVGKWYA